MAPVTGSIARARDGHLRPAAGCRAEVEDARALLEEMEFLVQLEQLERRAAAIALGLGLPDIGIVELALQPAA
jgi:hypothetical protein